MNELADMSTMFDLMRTPEGISPIERLLNEFEAHETEGREVDRDLQEESR